MKTILIRIVTDCVLIVAVFLTPWWLWVLLALAGVALVDRHYELVIIALAADAAYAGGAHIWGGFFYTIIALALVAVSVILKPRLRFYTSG